MSDMKCPFCQTELEINDLDVQLLGCENQNCKHSAHYDAVGTKELWEALIQAKQDLEVTQKALDITNEKLRHCVNITVEELDELKGNLLIAHNALLHFSKDPIAINALKKITAPKQEEK